MQDAQLRDALEEILENINDQIELIADLAVNMKPPCKVNEVRTMQGDFMVTPLLVAKSQILTAMAYISPPNSFVVYNNGPGYNEEVARENYEAFVDEAKKPLLFDEAKKPFLFDGSMPKSHRGHGCSADPDQS